MNAVQVPLADIARVVVGVVVGLGDGGGSIVERDIVEEDAVGKGVLTG